VAKTITSIRELSAALKKHKCIRGKSALAEILKDPRWHEAGFAVSAPWPADKLPKMAKWINTQLQEDRSKQTAPEKKSKEQKTDVVPPGEAQGLDEVKTLIAREGLNRAGFIAKLSVSIERAANLKVDRMIKEREYISRVDAEENDAKKNLAIRQSLQQVPRALRQILADTTDPAEVERILTTALKTLCNIGFEGDDGSNSSTT
jgi:hypothetical protein